MEKLKMQTADMAERNIEILGQMFPNCLTEVKNEEGKIVRAIDFDKLRQELACEVVEGAEERYQFTWPDKRNAIRLANAPTNKTLRPCREESVDFDNTQNLYIEGDNLDVLKVLRETYLGKVKMIYIDPPYNTGKDFVYNDDFAKGATEFNAQSGLFDEEGNRMADPMVQNTESNGRFHTDWLNMIYPRLKVAKDLLADEGVIFISIDENEIRNLRVVCDEIFGNNNFITQFTRKGSGGRQDSKYYAIVHEYILCYSRNINNFTSGKIIKTDDSYPFFDEQKGLNYKTQLLRKWGENSRRSDRPNLFYPITDPDGNDHYPMLNETEEGCWRWGQNTMTENIAKGMVEFKQRNGVWVAYEKIFEPTGDDVKTKLYTTIIDDIANNTGAALLKELFEGKIFDYPKPVDLMVRVLQLANANKDSLVLDFFSGSATTAHAVMQLNAEDGGNRRFIMVQLPEKTDEESESYKAGYKNICEIGKERIRRAGKKIREELQDKIQTLGFTINSLLNAKLSATVAMLPKQEQEDIAKKVYNEQILPKIKEREELELKLAKLDAGFRVLKLDESNMADVYYTPAEMPIQATLAFDALVDNIREGRTAEDLLFQVLPECNLPLSSKIEEREIHGKKVFVVEDGYLIACFDNDINESVITTIAKEKPYYFVMCDRSIATDNVADNFDQIFNAYSKETVRRIL